MIVKLLSNLTRSGKRIEEPESKIELKKNVIKNATRFCSVNEDSKGIPGDYLLDFSLEQIGRNAVIGFVDVKNVSSVEDGEKRIYSRDSGGNIKAEVYLYNNGEIALKNDSAAFSVSESGLFNLTNQVQELSSLIIELFSELRAITTTGGPTSHVIDAATQARLTALEQKFNQLIG